MKLTQRKGEKALRCFQFHVCEIFGSLRVCVWFCGCGCGCQCDFVFRLRFGVCMCVLFPPVWCHGQNMSNPVGMVMDPVNWDQLQGSQRWSCDHELHKEC